MLRKLLATLTLLVGLVSGATAQTVDTTVVKVPYTDSVKVIAGQDTTFSWKTDSTKVVARVDTTWAFLKDSTKVIAGIDTTWRDSVFTTCCRDSLVFTPKPPPATAGIDTAGFKLLGRVLPTAQNDKGTGPIPLGVGGWTGQMYYDANAPAPHTQAIRWFYRDGCWGGTSPGYAWFESGLAAKKVHDTYYTTYLRFADNWVGHVVGTKLMLLGFGTNGNQLILRQWGSANSATGALTFGLAWQGGSTTNPGRTVIGGTQPSASGSWNIAGIQPLRRGVWYKIEIQTHAAPQGTAGSWIKVFVDGKLVLYIMNMDLMNWNGDPYLAAVKQSPVWGGGPSCTAAGGQNMWMSGIQVWGK